MNIGVLKEKNDARVSLIPVSVEKLIKSGHSVCVETNAGAGAFQPDKAYTDAGATIVSRAEVIEKADLLLSISPVDANELSNSKETLTQIALFAPFNGAEALKPYATGQRSVFSLDMIPRTTLAQSMDVLSSMASIAGYKAVLMAANALPAYFPMLSTAAGSIPPAKVLVLGAGVAGLQAIATAKRLGAVVEASDVRAAAGEEVRSLGAKFLEVEGAKDDKGAGGYAVEQTEDYKKRQQELVQDRASKSDVIIATAQLRGRPAPLLISKETVDKMQPGSVIIDLAASTGGNAAYTKDGETVEVNGVKIIGDSDLSAQMPTDASKLFSRNMLNFILHITDKEGNLTFKMEDEIIKWSCIIHAGAVRFGS
jgi:H+-translocating NAD(P) transhydrogenase subunit alpha